MIKSVMATYLDPLLVDIDECEDVAVLGGEETMAVESALLILFAEGLHEDRVR